MSAIHHILVPLDGSESSEAAAVAADDLASAAGARVTLLHVIETRPPQLRHHQRHLTGAGEAQEYLREVAVRSFSPDVKIATHVHDQAVRDVARGIADHAAELAPDLIVMRTHGGGGPSRWAFGSIAQQVVAAGQTPLLLIPDEPRAAFAIDSLVIPLDGSPPHESCLPLAMSLARLFGAMVRLVTIVPTVLDLRGERGAASRALPLTTAAALAIEQEQAAVYLERVCNALSSSGLEIECRVRRGDPIEEILASARDLPSPVIVMSTHGKSGSEAFWAGSVAPKVAVTSQVPILMVPLGKRG